MATYTVAAGDVGLAPYALTAATVDTVTFTDSVGQVELIGDGTADVWVTVDGSTPAVPSAHASTKSFRIPAGGMAILAAQLLGPGDTVKWISAGTPTVSVQKAQVA